MKERFVLLWVGLAAGSLGFASAPVGAVTVISEVFYDASGSDSGLAFIELFGTPGDSLDDMVLEGVNGQNGTVYTRLALSGVIPGDGVVLIGDDAGGGITGVSGVDLVGDVDYQNGPDSVVLRNSGGILDAVGYGSFGGAEIFAGEGDAAPDPPGGASIARFNPALDTDNNRIDFIAMTRPSPGTLPVISSVPLPAGLGLFGSGLMVILGTLRRAVR